MAMSRLPLSIPAAPRVKLDVELAASQSMRFGHEPRDRMRLSNARRWVSIGLAGFTWSFVSGNASADFSSRPYGLRLLATVDRQSNYASTLGRQASLAFLNGGSINPAAAGWRTDPNRVLDLTGSVVAATSSDGGNAIAGPVSARLELPDSASAFLAYAHTRMPYSTGNDGLNQGFASDEFFVGYTGRVTESLAAGVNVRVVRGQISNEFFAPAIGGQPAKVVTDLSGPDVWVGLAGIAGEGISAGVVGTFGGLNTTNVVQSVGPVFIPGPSPDIPVIVLPPGSTLDQFDDRVKSFAVRAGIGVQATEQLGIYGDFNYFHIEGQRTGSLDIGRVALGSELSATPQWTLRAGVSIDTQSQVNWSAGFGYAFNGVSDLQFGFQTNAAPEVNAEVGRTRLFGVSVHARF